MTCILNEEVTDADRSLGMPLEDLAKYWYKLLQSDKLVTTCCAGQGSLIVLALQNWNIQLLVVFHIIEDSFEQFAPYENFTLFSTKWIHVHVYVHITGIQVQFYCRWNHFFVQDL